MSTTVAHRIENAEVARVLREIADLLEVKGENAFRIRAYRNAARVVEELPHAVQDAGTDGYPPLTDLPGIGEDLAGKIATIARTGKLPLVSQLRRSAPAGAAELMHVRGIGPKRARALSQKLGVHSVADLSRAVRGHKLRRLRGFGARTEDALQRELTARTGDDHRTQRATAIQYADEVARYLRESAGVEHVELAGSLRRCRETVGDIDVLVASDDPAAVVERFTSYPGTAEVLERGDSLASIRLESRLQLDLRVVEPASFGAALHYFTGSKAHNIAVRRIAQRKGLKLNEYGVYRGTRRIAGRDEREVFAAVGLLWIPPELREARGEIEAAQHDALPRLVTLDDIRGDLQVHTTDSDGRDTLDAMAHAAHALGYEYLAVTDHTPALRVAGGLDAAGFRRQWKRIDRLNARLRGLTILRGVEVDIHADGTLDLDDESLRGFDIVIAAIHSGFELSRAAQTKRLLRAIAHPAVHVIAHPTGRAIGRRQPIALDLDAICHAAAEHDVALEVNGQPERLDLDDIMARRAIDLGVHLVIDTDAHSIAELRFMRWGVDQARRGWVTRRDVLNTKPLAHVLRSLTRR
jgi:DNA polymerase (family 10)